MKSLSSEFPNPFKHIGTITPEYGLNEAILSNNEWQKWILKILEYQTAEHAFY